MATNLIRIFLIIKFVFYYFVFPQITLNDVECQNPFKNSQLEDQRGLVPNNYQPPNVAHLPNELQMQFRRPIQNEFQLQYAGQIPNLVQEPNKKQVLQGFQAQYGAHVPNEDKLLGQQKQDGQQIQNVNQNLFDTQVQNNAQVPNEGLQLMKDSVQYRAQISNQGQQLFGFQEQYEEQIPKQAQLQSDAGVQVGAQVPNEGQQLLEDQEEYRAQMLNQAQQPFESPVQYEAEAPLVGKIINLPQVVLAGERPNLANMQYGAQISNNIQQTNEVQVQNEAPYFFDDIVSPNTRTDTLSSTFTSGFKFFQKMFFDDMEKDAFKSTQSGLKPKVSLECANSLKDFLSGFMEGRHWALRVIDSFGKIPSGILDGTLRAFGDFDMCVNTKVPEFQGKYCLVAMTPPGNSSTWPRLKPMDVSFLFNRDFTEKLGSYANVTIYAKAEITTSICLPSTCSKSEANNVITKVTSYGPQSVSFKVKDCMVKHEYILNSTQKIIFSLMLALILFEVLATFIDVRMRNLYGKEFYSVELSKTAQCILAFSYYSNAKRLLKKDENPDSVKIFHGMKFISLAWVIFGHSVSFFVETLGRLYDAFLLWSGFFFQIVANTLLATETFIFMGGFLVVYTFVKAKHPRVSFILFALYRFIRLIPPVLFCLGILILAENWSSGPLWKTYVIDYLVGTCKSTWWINLLFVNNLFNIGCLTWTWYIAVDMQLYLSSYFIVLLFRRNPKKAVFLLQGIIVSNVTYLMYYYAAYKLPPQASLIYSHIDDKNYVSYMIHYKTLNHVTPYCMGMLTGYFIATKKKFHLSRAKKFFCWCLAIFALILCLFGTYAWNHRGRVATTTEAALYGGTYRLFWSFMLSWGIYLCMNGEARIIKSFLAADCFVLLGRLTYMAYLIHPLVQILSLGELRQTFFPEYKIMFAVFLFFLIISYMAAFIATLICESPFTRLLSVLISSNVSKSVKKRKESFSV